MMADALRDSVKPKKMHEIVHLSSLVDAVGRGGCCARVVDVGSGLGYLSRSLAFQYNWRVVGVEGSSAYVAEAQKIDEKVQRKLHKRMQDERPVEWEPSKGGLRHVAAHLPADCTPERFWRVLEEAGGGGGDGDGGGTTEVEGGSGADEQQQQPHPQQPHPQEQERGRAPSSAFTRAATSRLRCCASSTTPGTPSARSSTSAAAMKLSEEGRQGGQGVSNGDDAGFPMSRYELAGDPSRVQDGRARAVR